VTRDECKVLVKAMKAVYTQENFIPDIDAFNVWFALLEDLPYKVANLAVQKYMVSEHFPPTIADIRNKATEIVSDEVDDLNELAAWNLVAKALRNGYYGAEEEYAKLPPVVQKAVGSPAAIREMSMMDSDSLHTVEKSHFLRVYRAELQRAKDDAKLPPAMRKLIAEISHGVGIEGRVAVMQIGEENGEIGNLQQGRQTDGS